MPDFPGGTMILWLTTRVSSTAPRMSPADTRSPGFTNGAKRHFFSRLRLGTSTPRASRSPEIARMASSGRWMPS